MDLRNVANLTIQEGEVKSIHNSDGTQLWGKLSYDTKYMGDSAQNGTPTPDSPVLVSVVTGPQSITISDGNNQNTYTVDLGSIELVKIGEKQDYIYKNGSNWYIHKETGKYTFSPNENWGTDSYGVNSWKRGGIFINYDYDAASITLACDFAQAVSFNKRASGDSTQSTVCYTNASGTLTIRNTTITTLANIQAAAAGKDIYYWATSSNSQITDSALISQLEAVHQFLTRYGYTYTISGDLPLVISQTNLS